MEDLILHAHILYDYDVAPHSPPLPPTPAGEPVPPVSYGTKRTKVATIPSAGDTLSPLLIQDFTPRLPPRPNNSIHPSGRGNTSSPSQAKAPPLPEKLQASVQLDKITVIEESPSSSPTAESFMTGTEETRDDRNSIYFPVQDSPPTPPKTVSRPPQDPDLPVDTLQLK